MAGRASSRSRQLPRQTVKGRPTEAGCALLPWRGPGRAASCPRAAWRSSRARSCGIPARSHAGCPNTRARPIKWASRRTSRRTSTRRRSATRSGRRYVSPDQEICGGKVLDRSSLGLPDLSPECDTILIAEARYELRSKRRGHQGQARAAGVTPDPPAAFARSAFYGKDVQPSPTISTGP